MITYVAIPYQAYQLSHSTLVVGLLSAVEFVTLLVVPLIGGALADAVDRRRLVLTSELLLAAASLFLLVNATLLGQHLWVLFVVAGLMAAFDGLQRPPLDALLPRLVDRDELAAAGAISSLQRTAGAIAGPALGGVLIAAAGVGAAYAVDVATFVVSLVLLSMMRAVPPPEDAERPSLKGVLDGLRFAMSRQELLGTYTVDIIAMFFGMPMALFPGARAAPWRRARPGPALHGPGAGRAARLADQRLERARAPPRRGRVPGRRGLGRRHRAAGLRARPGLGAGGAHRWPASAT